MRVNHGSPSLVRVRCGFLPLLTIIAGGPEQPKEKRLAASHTLRKEEAEHIINDLEQRVAVTRTALATYWAASLRWSACRAKRTSALISTASLVFLPDRERKQWGSLAPFKLRAVE